MKKTIAAIAGVMMLAAIGAAHAGVVVDEQETMQQGAKQAASRQRTVVIQGNKQKMISNRIEVITDLDQGKLFLIYPAQKQYMELPFPPQGAMARMMTNQMSTLQFKKSGGKKTILGYSCAQYSGAGSMMGNQYSVTGCFSTKAPGAKEFDAFQKAMADKVKGTPMAMQGQVPNGIPMELVSTTKLTNFSAPGMTPEQAEKIRQMLANRPPMVTKTVVTKVTTKKLSADTFAVPAGFTKREMRQPAPPPAGAGAPPPGTKVPE
jgi:hypothetical protein